MRTIIFMIFSNIQICWFKPADCGHTRYHCDFSSRHRQMGLSYSKCHTESSHWWNRLGFLVHIWCVWCESYSVLLTTFENVLTFSITVWFGSITQKETLRLNRVVKTASRIICSYLNSQYWNIVSAALVRKGHSHLSRFIPSCPWPVWTFSI